jgi:hypothetical protein
MRAAYACFSILMLGMYMHGYAWHIEYMTFIMQLFISLVNSRYCVHAFTLTTMAWRMCMAAWRTQDGIIGRGLYELLLIAPAYILKIGGKRHNHSIRGILREYSGREYE